MAKKKQPETEIDPAIMDHIESADPEYLRLEKSFAKKISNMVLALEADPADFDARAKTIDRVARIILIENLGMVTDPRVVAVRERLRELSQ